MVSASARLVGVEKAGEGKNCEFLGRDMHGLK